VTLGPEAGMATPALQSARLRAIAAMVLENQAVADVGTDHALLPVFLVSSGRVPHAVAVDVARGPLRGAQQHVDASNTQVKVRLGDGLQCLQPGEVQTVVMAGMGGPRMCRVLQRDQSHLTGVLRLVLQPNHGAEELRHVLQRMKWSVVEETVVWEHGRPFEVIAFEPRHEHALSELDGWLGPRNVGRADTDSIRWVSWNLAQLQRERDKVPPTDSHRRNEMERRMALLDDLLGRWN